MSQYVRDLSEAALDDELVQSKVPILVDFWAPWCGPCRAMSPAVEAAAQKLSDGAKVYKVNVDDNPSLEETGPLPLALSVSRRRLSGRLETLDQQQQRDDGQGQQRDNPEAIHEGQQTYLALQLLVEVPVCGGGGIRT